MRMSRQSFRSSRNKRKRSTSHSARETLKQGLSMKESRKSSKRYSISRDIECDNNETPTLAVICPVLDHSIDALDHKAHKLRKKSQHHSGRITQKNWKYQKWLRTQLEGTWFDESDPIIILAFLKKFCYARNHTRIHIRVSMWLFFHFVIKPVSSSLAARLSS